MTVTGTFVKRWVGSTEYRAIVHRQRIAAVNRGSFPACPSLSNLPIVA